MRHIKVLGITGGVGAGKSTVLARLSEQYHAEVLELDKAAHFLMEPGQACYQKIIGAFGTDICGTDGVIMRERLAVKAFASKDNIRILNSIVHPQVKEYVKEWIAKKQEEQEAPFLVLEAALLLEEHYDEICDEIWYIHVSDEVRRRRLKASRGYSDKKITQILKNQKKEADFRALCQFVVDNSSDVYENTYGQIDKGLREHEFV